VQSALFENNVFLVAQHMMQFAVTGKAAAPMPSRISAWAHVRRVHRGKAGEQIFLAAVSDTQWASCAGPRLADLKATTRAWPATTTVCAPRLDDARCCASAWPATRGELARRFQARPAVCAHHAAAGPV
jgi:crotonobetainyl-CoA:carnitine CoA-transferase CaiB-like acyl-CoA transferase